jgi:hypothetical protein
MPVSLVPVVAVPSLSTGRPAIKLPLPMGLRHRRLMKLRTVPENHKLGEEGLWDRIRAEARGVLDAQQSVG